LAGNANTHGGILVMDDASRFKMSRRDMLAASIAGPALGGLGIASIHDSHGDAVVMKAAEWMSERQRLDEMTHQWQRLETQLFRRARGLGVEIEEARGRQFPEVRTMRMLDERRETAYTILGGLAKEASVMRAFSLDGALAKIDLGLRVQGRYNWHDNALQLVEGGVSELRTFTA
jgi:hypothetical protein